MSEIIWANSRLPAPDAPLAPYRSEHHGERSAIGPVKRIAVETLQVQLPDPRVHRSISRAAVLMASLCLEAKPILDPFLAENPYSVGIYAAIENGPVDYTSVTAMTDTSSGPFAEKYRKLRNPKMYLKQLPNLAAAQTGIFLGVRGPMNVYTHSTLAGWQALDQADSDLESGEVKLALVCTATGFEDPLAVLRAGREAGARTLHEGASGLLLKPNGKRRSWGPLETRSSYFGIGEKIFQVANAYKN